jgi:hypothetical protein
LAGESACPTKAQALADQGGTGASACQPGDPGDYFYSFSRSRLGIGFMPSRARKQAVVAQTVMSACLEQRMAYTVLEVCRASKIIPEVAGGVRCDRRSSQGKLFNQSHMVVTVEPDIGITGVGESGAKDTLEQCAGSLTGEDPRRGSAGHGPVGHQGQGAEAAGAPIVDNVYNTHERVRIVAQACKEVREGVGKNLVENHDIDYKCCTPPMSAASPSF